MRTWLASLSPLTIASMVALLDKSEESISKSSAILFFDNDLLHFFLVFRVLFSTPLWVWVFLRRQFFLGCGSYKAVHSLASIMFGKLGHFVVDQVNAVDQGFISTNHEHGAVPLFRLTLTPQPQLSKVSEAFW